MVSIHARAGRATTSCFIPATVQDNVSIHARAGRATNSFIVLPKMRFLFQSTLARGERHGKLNPAN